MSFGSTRILPPNKPLIMYVHRVFTVCSLRALPLPFDREEDDQLTERTHHGEGHQIRPALWVAGLAGRIGREDEQGGWAGRMGREDGQGGSAGWQRKKMKREHKLGERVGTVSVCIKSDSFIARVI
jgi:hypothetical protein